MRGVQQCPQLAQRPCFQHLDRSEDPGILRHHVAGAPVERRRQLRNPREIHGPDCAQAGNSEAPGSVLAFVPSDSVFAAGMGMGDTGVEHGQAQASR
jgi:hypothetical protein